MKEIYVVAGIIEYNNKILCMQRGQDKHDYTSFKWEFPGGKIERGETKEEALKREILEEMNVNIDISELFCEIKYTYPDFILNMYCYKCSINLPQFELIVHKDYRWLERSKLNTLDWAPADYIVIDKLMAEEK
ncbi:MAG: (deoxy)nucleoside triphosphate pyrophosphohydrolase [Christensenellales bacterium]